MRSGVAVVTGKIAVMSSIVLILGKNQHCIEAMHQLPWQAGPVQELAAISAATMQTLH